MKDCALVLEGGALRGVFTSGVLDVLMEQGLYLPYVIGVSAGSLNAFGYLSRQEALRIDYLQVPIQDNTLTAEAMRTLREMLG